MEKENVSPSKDNHPVKKGRLLLLLKGKHRFQATSDNDLAKLSKPQVPKNTDISTRWAMKNFTDWYQDLNARNPEEPCPKEDISPKCSAELLKTWLCVFISETRNQNASNIPQIALFVVNRDSSAYVWLNNDTHTHTHTYIYIYIYIYTLNPMQSNHRDGSTP